MTHVTLNEHEVRRLLDTGSVLWVRPVKEQPPEDTVRIYGPEWYEPTVEDRFGNEIPGDPIFGIYDEDGEWGVKCPLAPGAVAWGRERYTYADTDGWDHVDVHYAADDSASTKTVDNLVAESVLCWIEDREVDGNGDNWRSPVIMPRWASRFPRLRVGTVRCVRVDKLGEADYVAAGFDDEIAEYNHVHFETDWYNRYRYMPWAEQIWTAWAWAVELTAESEGE